MVAPRHLLRLVRINRVLVRHGLDELILAAHLYRPLRIMRLFLPWNWGRRSLDKPRGERIRLALEALGPIFVKFGQALSTRPDLLPLDIAEELAKLQDRVPPFPGAQAKAIAEKAYGKPLDEIFAEFNEEPLAAASVAQVHTARLSDGRDVIVKILRPNMKEVIQRDLDVLYVLADLAHRYWQDVRRLRPREVVAEYEKTILNELDLIREAGNTAHLRRNFAGSPLLYVPEVYWEYCRLNVLVMEQIHGVPISDVETLKKKKTDMQKLAENGVEIFFTQVFRHNFFHADMHPGNIFVDVSNPKEPRYMAVDFGIVGTLSPRDQHYLAENFLAFFDRDYHRIAQLHIDSGWVPAATRVDELESAVRTVCEPIFNKPLKDISFGRFLLHLFQTARKFNMEVQPQLVLLQKTLFNIEGLGRQLYPDLDLWKTAYPIMKVWMAERISGRMLLKQLRDRWPEVQTLIQEGPKLLIDVLKRASEGELKIEVNSSDLRRMREEQQDNNRRRYWTIAGAALIVSGTILVTTVFEPRWLGWATATAGLLALILGKPRS